MHGIILVVSINKTGIKIPIKFTKTLKNEHISIFEFQGELPRARI